MKQASSLGCNSADQECLLLCECPTQLVTKLQLLPVQIPRPNQTSAPAAQGPSTPLHSAQPSPPQCYTSCRSGQPTCMRCFTTSQGFMQPSFTIVAVAPVHRGRWGHRWHCESHGSTHRLSSHGGRGSPACQHIGARAAGSLEHNSGSTKQWQACHRRRTSVAVCWHIMQQAGYTTKRRHVAGMPSKSARAHLRRRGPGGGAPPGCRRTAAWRLRKRRSRARGWACKCVGRVTSACVRGEGAPACDAATDRSAAQC